MSSRRTVRLTAAAAAAGALLALGALWVTWPDPPPCTTLENGMRACMPVLVVPPPWWLYCAVAAVGSLLTGGVTYAVARRLPPRAARG